MSFLSASSQHKVSDQLFLLLLQPGKVRNCQQKKLKKQNLMSIWFDGNVMQFQARCNSATPSTKRKRELNIFLLITESFVKKKYIIKTCKSVQPKYIWDLHLKLHYGYIHFSPYPYHLSQVVFIQTLPLRKHSLNRKLDHSKHPFKTICHL